MRGFIEDGAIYEGYVKASEASQSGERLWDAVEFTYSPPTLLDLAQVDGAVKVALRNADNDPQCAVDAEVLACEFVAKRLKKWDVKNRAGNLVPITKENVLRICGPVFNNMYLQIRLARLADLRPETEAQESDADSSNQSLTADQLVAAASA